jgi:hypothetical protein
MFKTLFEKNYLKYKILKKMTDNSFLCGIIEKKYGK